MRAYSLAKRRAVLVACDAGHGTKTVAEQFGVSPSWVRRVKQRRCQPRISFRSRTRRRVPRWAEYEDQIDELMQQHQLTLRELKEALGTELSIATLSRALQRMNWSKRVPRARLDGDFDW